MRIAVGAALALLAGAPMAHAQSTTRHRPRPRPRVIEVPPPRLGPQSLGLLEQDFARMRATSPNPNNFQYGRWNPQFQTIFPSTPSFGGGWWYTPYPVYGAYPTYPYNPYYGPYGGYGYQAPVVQREVIVVPQPRREEEPARPESPRRPAEEKPQAGATETVADALDDIRKAWLNGDVARLRARLKADGKVRLYPQGEYRYAVDAAEFGAMLENAMKNIDTVSFDFDRPTSTEAGRAFVTGRHVYLDAGKARQTTYISYMLERVGGKWRIVEAGSSNQPIAQHQQ
jgi:hypothetical protein